MSTAFDCHSARRRTVSFSLAALCILWQSHVRAEEPKNREAAKSKPAAAQFARDIVGVWTRRAIPPGGASQVAGRQYKFFTDKYWVATHRDDSGYMIYAVGGTYDLVDGNYTESDKFGTYYCRGLIGGVFTFKIDVDQKNFWQVGMNNEYTEKYTRVVDEDQSPLAQRLHGAWTRTAADGPKLTQYKFYESGVWIELHTNKDGLAITARSGTYKLADDILIEETSSSTDFTAYPTGEVDNYRVVAKEGAISLTAADDQQTEQWTRAE